MTLTLARSQFQLLPVKFKTSFKFMFSSFRLRSNEMGCASGSLKAQKLGHTAVLTWP